MDTVTAPMPSVPPPAPMESATAPVPFDAVAGGSTTAASGASGGGGMSIVPASLTSTGSAQ